MSSLSVQWFRGWPEFLALRDEWNRLWESSDSRTPSDAHEPIALWIETFAEGQEPQFAVARSEGRVVGGVVLVRGTWHACLPAMTLTHNEWLETGGLLVAEDVDVDRVSDALACELHRRTRGLLLLPYLRVSLPKNARFLASLARAGFTLHARPMYEASHMDLSRPWPAYEASLSKGIKKSLRSSWRKLSELGDVTYERVSPQSLTDLKDEIDRALEVEDRSWKAQQGTSFHSRPQMEAFFRRVSEVAWNRGAFEVAFLRLDARPVAFEFLWRWRGVFGSYKVGYEERFARFQPGKLLLARILEDLCTEGGHRVVDCIGPTTVELQRMGGISEPVHRVIGFRNEFPQRAVMGLYEAFRPSIPWASAATT